MFTEQLHSNEGFLLPPERVTTFQPFIAVGDLDVVASKIAPKLARDSMIAQMQQRLLKIQRRYAPNNSSFYYIAHEALVSKTEEKVLGRMNGETGVGIINFDRYLFRGGASGDHLRLELSRGADNKLIARPGATTSKEEQIQALRKWLEEGSFKRVILIDDVIAFATTFLPVIEMVREILPNVQVEAVAGICSREGTWRGEEKLNEVNVGVQAVIMAAASPATEGGTSGMAIPDSRDSTVFGGKIGKTVEGRSMSYPYFYPFSVPTLSLMRGEGRQQASLEWMQFNIDLVTYISGCLGRHMTVEDLEANGFGVPHTSIEAFKDRIAMPASEDSLLEYLRYVQSITLELFSSL